MKFFWREMKGPIALLVLVCGSVFTWTHYVDSNCDDERTDLVKQCESSGLQHFECVAKFQSYCKSGSTYVPIYVNGGK